MAARRDPDEEEAGPERTCIVTRAKGAPEALVRFVVGPGDIVVPDVRGRLPGRGAWVTGSAAAVEQAVRRGAFPRAFKRAVTVAPTLVEDVEALLAGDAVAALAMANKAGKVLAGAFKIESGLRKHAMAALLHAREASPDGIRKLDGAARRETPDGRVPPRTLQIFDSAQMDLALGRVHVIHAALLVGGTSEAALNKADRLHAYRVATLPPKTGKATESPRTPDQTGADAIRP